MRLATLDAAMRRGWVWPISGPGRRRVELAAAHGERDLGQLRGLARAGLAADDHHLVGRDRGHDLLALGGDRQGFGESDAQGRQGGEAQSP